MVKQTRNNCVFASLCQADPCNRLGQGFVDKTPGLPYKVDTCSQSGNCRMVPGSMRCMAHRCPDCQLWVNKADAPEHTDEELKKVYYVFKIMKKEIRNVAPGIE